MKRIFTILLLSISMSGLLFTGCATTSPQGFDYSNYLANMPNSILVLPPTNQSTEVMAPYIYLSTVTRSLAERGYYVFPVAVVDAMLKDNGLPTPDEMAQVSLKKIKEVINPDAVLYVTIVEWGAKYQLVDTVTKVHIQGRLVDTDTGTILWQGDHTVVQDSNRGASYDSLVGVLVSAFVAKIVTEIADPTREISYRANYELFTAPRRGLLTGRYNSGYEEEQRSLKEPKSEP